MPRWLPRSAGFMFPKLEAELNIEKRDNALLGMMLGLGQATTHPFPCMCNFSCSSPAIRITGGVGQAVGAASLGALSDMIGRKPSLRLALIITAGFGAGSAVSQSLGVLAFFWLFIGFGIGGSLPTGFVSSHSFYLSERVIRCSNAANAVVGSVRIAVRRVANLLEEFLPLLDANLLPDRQHHSNRHGQVAPCLSVS